MSIESVNTLRRMHLKLSLSLESSFLDTPFCLVLLFCSQLCVPFTNPHSLTSSSHIPCCSQMLIWPYYFSPILLIFSECIRTVLSLVVSFSNINIFQPGKQICSLLFLCCVLKQWSIFIQCPSHTLAQTNKNFRGWDPDFFKLSR